LDETIWSLTSPRVKRISGFRNFRSPPQKDFCNNICQQAKSKAWLGDRQQRRFHITAARLCPASPAPPQFTGPAWLLVHAQLAASVRIKSAALPTNAGEKNEPTGGVAESIGSLNDLIQLAEGRRLGFVHASSAGRERSPFCSY
jgi:hypothetical protein